MSETSINRIENSSSFGHETAKCSLEDLSLVKLLAAKVTFPTQVLLNEFLRLV